MRQPNNPRRREAILVGDASLPNRQLGNTSQRTKPGNKSSGTWVKPRTTVPSLFVCFSKSNQTSGKRPTLKKVDILSWEWLVSGSKREMQAALFGHKRTKSRRVRRSCGWNGSSSPWLARNVQNSQVGQLESTHQRYCFHRLRDDGKDGNYLTPSAGF